MKNILASLFGFLLMMSLVSCNDFLDINDDPNNPSEVPAALTLPSAQLNMAVALNADYAVVGGLWAQHWAQSHVASQYRDEDRYDLTRLDYQVAWSEMYAGALIDLAKIEDEAVATGNWNLNLQAVCLSAFAYQILADWYNAIPYGEALGGESGNVAPAYQPGDVVYADLLTRIDAALAQDFTGAGVAQVPSDFVFGSLSEADQIAAWTDFANTLKLKLWLRQTKVNDSGAGTAIAALLGSGVTFLTQDAKLDIFTDLPDKSTPIYESNVRQLNVKTNLRGSRTFVSWLQENGDPRLDAYFTPGTGGHFGLWQGWFDAPTPVVPEQAPDVANLFPDQPVYFFSTDEVNFMLAEAHARYGSAGEAEGFYDAGVNGACARVGVDCSALVDGGYAYPNGSVAENIEAIITQKWASLVYRGYEAFWDHLRTGVPAIYNGNGLIDPFNPPADYVPGTFTYSVGGKTSGAFPQRLVYPESERNTNQNIPAEVALTVPVWWAQ
ncbi:MAG TPA: SusD/RagB family nutrient-binding outer membrane lipoprotein [Saprospiraceae bacterium]